MLKRNLIAYGKGETTKSDMLKRLLKVLVLEALVLNSTSLF
jgi:hypothetical protein